MIYAGYNSFVAMVQSLQPLVQWLCDLSVTILSSLPVSSAKAKTGSWLAKSLPSISTIRELLLLVRLWYNTVPKLRPALSSSMSCDILAKIFKLISTLFMSLKRAEPLSDSLLDECSLLQTQVTMSQT